MGFKNMRAICPACGGKIHTQPKGFLGAVAIGANGPLVKTGTTCQHCGVALTGKVTLQNYAVIDEQAQRAAQQPGLAAPVSEERAAYLARVNAKPVPAEEVGRCNVRGGGRQCIKAEGHEGGHDFSKKVPKHWAS